MTVHLIDEGTLDTVFECETCGARLAYSGDAIERDEDGCVLDSEFGRVEEEHADECGLDEDE